MKLVAEPNTLITTGTGVLQFNVPGTGFVIVSMFDLYRNRTMYRCLTGKTHPYFIKHGDTINVGGTQPEFKNVESFARWAVKTLSAYIKKKERVEAAS